MFKQKFRQKAESEGRGYRVERNSNQMFECALEHKFKLRSEDRIPERPYGMGQIVMYDIMFACLIFAFALGAVYLVWNSNVAAVQQRDIREIAERDAAILDALVRSSGEPSAWEDNPNTAEVIGLARSDRVLDEQKVAAFAAMDYNESKKLLRTLGYDYLFELDGVEDLNAGTQPAANSYKVRLKRIVTYKGEVANVALTLHVEK